MGRINCGVFATSAMLPTVYFHLLQSDIFQSAHLRKLLFFNDNLSFFENAKLNSWKVPADTKYTEAFEMHGKFEFFHHKTRQFICQLILRRYLVKLVIVIGFLWSRNDT